MALQRDFFWGMGGAKHPALEAAWVDAVQEELGVQLPALYLELLRVRNGGSVRFDSHACAVPTAWSKDHVPFSTMTGIGPEEDAGLLRNATSVREWELPEGLVLLDGEGHWWMALDYRASSEPCVTWVAPERDEDIRIAPDFPSFVSGLQRSTGRHGRAFAASISELEAELGAALGVSFGPSALIEGHRVAEHPSWLNPWGSAARVVLAPNRELIDGSEYLEFPELPDHPTVLWAELQTADALDAALGPFDPIRAHVPPWSE